jgi:Rod binding domain-containing protein
MNLDVIPALSTAGTDARAVGSMPADVAREFEALLWETLVRESRLFRNVEADGLASQDPMMGSMLDQVLASQLARSIDLGIGRAALGREEGGVS